MNDFRVPTVPGRASADESLGMLTPSVSANTTRVTVSPSSDAAIVSIPARKTVILQALNDVWVGINTPALPDQTLLLPGGAVIGFDLASNIAVNLRSAVAGNAIVTVIQLGQML